jgi:hypothetical protein
VHCLSPLLVCDDGRYGGIGVLAGLILGAIADYVVALRCRRFESSDGPQRFFGVPIFGEVPVFSGDVGSGQGQAIALPILSEPLGSEAESYRAIATSIRLIRGTESSLAIFITSARAGAGETTLVANCGLAFARWANGFC